MVRKIAKLVNPTTDVSPTLHDLEGVGQVPNETASNTSLGVKRSAASKPCTRYENRLSSCSCLRIAPKTATLASQNNPKSRDVSVTASRPGNTETGRAESSVTKWHGHLHVNRNYTLTPFFDRVLSDFPRLAR